MLRAVLTSIVLLVTSTGAMGIDEVAEGIPRQLELAGEPAMVRFAEGIVHASRALPSFYEQHGFAPDWGD